MESHTCLMDCKQSDRHRLGVTSGIHRVAEEDVQGHALMRRFGSPMPCSAAMRAEITNLIRKLVIATTQLVARGSVSRVAVVCGYFESSTCRAAVTAASLGVPPGYMRQPIAGLVGGSIPKRSFPLTRTVGAGQPRRMSSCANCSWLTYRTFTATRSVLAARCTLSSSG